jgi:hypothetical protein
MSLTGLRRQEEHVNRGKPLNFPSSDLIMWAELYPNEPQTWAHHIGLRRNRNISHCGLMVKEVYEGVEAIAQERNVPVESIWEDLAKYDPKNGFFFDSDFESSYRKLDKYATLSDSGSAYAGTMRTIQWISQNGVDSKYIKEDENDLISELFANEDMVRVSIVSLSFLVFIGKIAYDEYSK